MDGWLAGCWPTSSFPHVDHLIQNRPQSRVVRIQYGTNSPNGKRKKTYENGGSIECMYVMEINLARAYCLELQATIDTVSLSNKNLTPKHQQVSDHRHLGAHLVPSDRIANKEHVCRLVVAASLLGVSQCQPKAYYTLMCRE